MSVETGVVPRGLARDADHDPRNDRRQQPAHGLDVTGPPDPPTVVLPRRGQPHGHHVAPSSRTRSRRPPPCWPGPCRRGVTKAQTSASNAQVAGEQRDGHRGAADPDHGGGDRRAAAHRARADRRLGGPGPAASRWRSRPPTAMAMAGAAAVMIARGPAWSWSSAISS